MKYNGFIKINAITAGIIGENYNLIKEQCCKKGLTLINMFNLDTYLLGKDNDSSSYKPIMDEGLYLSVNINLSSVPEKFINNPYEDIDLSIEDSPLHTFLEEIALNLNIDGFYIKQYCPASRFKDLNSFGKNIIDFNNVDGITKRCLDIKNTFKPSNRYDTIHPIVRSNTQKVRKDGKMGLIDATTGKEMIPCEYKMIFGFDYSLGLYGTPGQQEKFKGKAISRVLKDNNSEQYFIDKEGNIY